MKVYAHNLTTENLEKSYLTASVSAAATAAAMKSNEGFSQNDRILVGEMGHERTEISKVNGAISGNTNLVTTALKFDHDTNTPVYVLDFDQVRFYRSTGGISGTYTLQATVDIDVDSKEMRTVWDDTSGTSAYYYEIEYYNSVSTTVSDQSDPIAGSGYTKFQIGRVIQEVAREVGDSAYEFISPEEWLGIANECSEDLQTRVKKPYSFLGTTEAVSTVASQGYIDLTGLTETIWKTKLILYNYTNSDGTDRTDPYRVMSFNDFKYRYSDNTATDSDKLEFIAYDEEQDRMLLYPIPATAQSNVFTFHFWKYFSWFDTLSDSIETPTTRVYKLFLRTHYYKSKGVQDRAFLALADREERRYESEAARLARYRKDAGSPKSFSVGDKGIKGERIY